MNNERTIEQIEKLEKWLTANRIAAYNYILSFDVTVTRQLIPIRFNYN